MLECGCCVLQICVAHHVVPYVHLGAVGHQFWLLQHLPFNLRSDSYVLHFFFFPLDLKFCDSRLLYQNVSSQLADVHGRRGVFNQVWKFFRVSVVHVVTNPEELLGVVVAAGEQDRRHSHNVVGRELRYVRDVAL